MALFCGQCGKVKPCGCGCKKQVDCRRCKYVKHPGSCGSKPVVSPKSCESCNECQSNVHICSFVIKKTEDVRKYHNSLVFVEEDNSTYWVDDDGIPVITYRMPMYVDDFDPTKQKVVANTVYDFKNHKMYIFDPAGDYQVADLKEDK